MKLRNTENGSGFYQRFYERPHEDNDPNKPQLFWDGFQWVVRGTTTNIQTFDLNTKPGRKVQIANISVKDLKEFIYEELVKLNYIDKAEKEIIKAVDLDYNQNAGVFVMESIDYAKRVTLLDGFKLLGYTLRISTYNEVQNRDKSSASTSSNSTLGGSLALANTAHLSAKSAAITFAAIQSFKNDQQQINLTNNSATNAAQLMSSRVIKVMNADPNEVDKMKDTKFDEIESDMRVEFDTYGTLKDVTIIRPNKRKIGAEIGSCFVHFEHLNHAEFCMKNMKGRRYIGREIKCVFIDEEVFEKELNPKKDNQQLV